MESKLIVACSCGGNKWMPHPAASLQVQEVD
jgi:hypothetical protein